MKRVFVVLLVLALLLPMCLVTQADAVEIKPFYMTNWEGFRGDYTYVLSMPYYWTDKSTLTSEEPMVGKADLNLLAEETKATMDSRPEGTRVMNFTMVQGAFFTLYEDGIILDPGIPVVQDWLHKFLKIYKGIGGQLDGLIIDVEFFNAQWYYINTKYAVSDPLIYDKIVKNPVYQEKIRPELEKRGFKFYPNPTEQTPEIYSISQKVGSEYDQSKAIWDAVLLSYSNDCVTEACSPVWEYYPDAMVCDYIRNDSKTWLKRISDDNGSASSSGGNISKAGNNSNEGFYLNSPKSTFYRTASVGPVYSNVVGYNNTVYEDSPYYRLMFDANTAKNIYLSAEDNRVSWWISHYLFTVQEKNTISNTPFYSELLFHLGMLNPELFLGYMISSEVSDVTDGDIEKYEVALEITDHCLAELTRMVGFADRKPIAVDATWNHQFVMSGMYAGGKNVWRLTPNTDKVSLKDFKVEGSDPTFSIGGETITFPQGKIVTDGKVTEIGTCGYWIETPADVMPVITRSENFYRENPALGETFDGYEVGTEYNYSNALPEAAWEVKQSKGSTATVVADPANANNQMVALKGNYTLNLKRLAKNVTAGDTYAERQAWEISFKLPADMAADAELILLNATGDKKKSKDGGFKIAGGKAYYSDNGEYKELEGVTLAADTLYTVIRDMDFTDAENITCDYYIYDAAGTLLGKAKDVVVATFPLPVDIISYGCANVAGEAVLLDNFKLYATGVAADFELYDEETGMQVADITQARASNTAYRLSWLNGTQKEKSYTVMAEYYEGDTKVSEAVVQEVKMAPGFDGVITGIVENKTEGQTVKVYLRDNNPPEEEEEVPGNNAPAPGDDVKLDKITIIIIAAAAAVVIAVVVIVIVVASKKKKKKAALAAGEGEEAETAEETEAVEEAETVEEAEAAPAAEETENTQTEE